MRLALLLLALVGGNVLAEPVDSSLLERGRRLFLESCARCHGEDARGSGVDGAALEPSPPDLCSSGFVRTHSDDEVSARVLDPHPTLAFKPIPESTPQTDALHAFLRRLPSIRWSEVDAGRALYLGRCSICHGRYGRGDGIGVQGETPRPPDLADQAFQRKLRHLGMKALVHPIAAGMIPLERSLSEAEKDAVASFVEILSPGYELYWRYCVGCHGPHGTGRREPVYRPFALDKQYFHDHYPSDVRERIWHMLRGARRAMPHFEGVLSQADVRAIIAYVRSLAAARPSARAQ